MDRGIEILSPASYLQNSNWLFPETRATKWTPEENKQFENALALYDKDEPDRWQKVAAVIPGKTVGDVIKQYRELEEDVSDIEAGLIPIPGYSSSDAFTLEWFNNNQGYDGFRHLLLEAREPPLPGLLSRKGRKAVPDGSAKVWQSTGGKDKRRSSIHDITTVNLPDTKSPSPDEKKSSPDHSTTSLQSQPQQKMVGMAKGLIDWKPQNEGGGAAGVFSQANGNLLMAPLCGISSYGQKLQEQNLLRGTLPGYQFAPYNLIFQMQPMQRQ
ncbi:hypothetical protein GH714_008520 [Hevea brasiliensis]|uniref:Uncharacterized protein n=1 Tax=Hevea brasiliensis TaxID=3981 RepID=A0A6A6KKC7_HEVBR|nr:hypothetical protein GH714_008520 [Hevea brasiliensis]